MPQLDVLTLLTNSLTSTLVFWLIYYIINKKLLLNINLIITTRSFVNKIYLQTKIILKSIELINETYYRFIFSKYVNLVNMYIILNVTLQTLLLKIKIKWHYMLNFFILKNFQKINYFYNKFLLFLSNNYKNKFDKKNGNITFPLIISSTDFLEFWLEGYIIFVIIIFIIYLFQQYIFSNNNRYTKDYSLKTFKFITFLSIIFNISYLLITIYLMYQSIMTEPSTKTIYVDSSLNNTLDTIFLYCILDNKLYMRILITLFILIGQIIINIYYYLIEKDTKEDVHDAAINVVLFLIATYSLILMLQVKNLIMLFLCLELQSLIVCILCSSKGKLLNIESSLKLYITGATSTGFLLMGSGLLYGATGSIDLEEIFMFLNYSNILADINYKIDLYHSWKGFSLEFLDLIIQQKQEYVWIEAMINEYKRMNPGVKVSFKELGLDFTFLDPHFSPKAIMWAADMMNLKRVDTWINVFDIWNYIKENNIKVEIFLGILFLIIGLLFKLGIFPFHSWMIDVYSGCPLYVFIYIVILPKIAVLYVFFCFMVSIAYYSIGILTIMQILLLFSMGLGVMGALFQTQIRRIIAFSGMVNISYIVWTMIDFQLDHMNVTTTLNNYVTFIALIVIYGITILSLSGSLITWQYIYGQNELIEIKNVHQLSGLWHINKTLCIYFLISIFSLTGVPPLFGFYTKFYLAAILLNHVAFEQGIVVLSWSCVSVLYYLGIIKILFFDKVYKGLFLKKQPIILYLIISTLCIIQLFFFIKPLILYILF